MAAAQGGDARAYRALLQAIEPWLGRWFRRRMMPAEADDLTQETMIAVHAKRHTYRPSQPFLPWLAAIARYKWIDHLRRTTRRAEDGLPPMLAADGDAGAGVIAALSIETLLAQLKPAQARAIRLVKLDGLSVEEASAASGQSVPLVKVNVHRGMAQLRRLLEESDDGEV